MTPQEQLDGFIDKFTPEVAARAREAIAAVKARLPGATMLVYDNYNALAIGFGATDKVSGIVCSIALYPRWVSLFLTNGPSLSDPAGLLEGGGSVVRHVKLIGNRLDDPAVWALLDAAHAIVAVPIDPAGGGGLIIKSISAKQRSRRP
ncbi:MAG: hypothetical protein E7773_05000 [Sphingomonas sp.]|uniref:hypothetical protein n=1 Tax=Sphingomonas sp. TaxID=28214 RepID=UPI00120907B4|nr:hypothetical protein [Sphingomonas sp.]THD37382.1 MAG: hypothetical protein E7773_05000 [Sphingomonas sp.]